MNSAARERDQARLVWWAEREEKLLYLRANRERWGLDDAEYDLAVVLNELFTHPATRRCGPVSHQTLGECIKRRRTRTGEIMKSLVRKTGIVVIPPAHQARYRAGGDSTEYLIPWDGVRRRPRQRTANDTGQDGENPSDIMVVSSVANDSRAAGVTANAASTPPETAGRTNT